MYIYKHSYEFDLKRMSNMLVKLTKHETIHYLGYYGDLDMIRFKHSTKHAYLYLLSLT